MCQSWVEIKTLFCCIFQSRYCVWSAVAQNFHSYALCQCTIIWHIYATHMSPSLMEVLQYSTLNALTQYAMELSSISAWDCHIWVSYPKHAKGITSKKTQSFHFDYHFKQWRGAKQTLWWGGREGGAILTDLWPPMTCILSSVWL